MTTSTYTRHHHMIAKCFSIWKVEHLWMIDDDIISKAKDWTAKTQDIIIDKSCVELCFDQVFVGTHVEMTLYLNHNTEEKRDLKNLEEIREILK